jgi:hypothetical protein
MHDVAAARTAFASYSSKDRDRVLDRIAAVRIAAGLDVFLDCLSLNPGEEWKPTLEAEISLRDIFLLFWSQAAADSEWVKWEGETAIEKKGDRGAAIQIHPLEVGISLPSKLSHLHRGDVLMHLRSSAGQADSPVKH